MKKDAVADEQLDKQFRQAVSKIERISPKKVLDAADLENLLGVCCPSRSEALNF